MRSWPSKDPQDVLDYQFDWTDELETGETITASTMAKTGSIVLGDADVAAGITTVWISGGTEGERCTVTNHITTSAGREYDETAALRIRTH